MPHLSRTQFGKYMTLLLQAFIVFIIIESLVLRHYTYVFGGILTLILTILPMVAERQIRLTIPWWLTFLIVLSLYIHLAGNYFQWYISLYPYYDKIGHLISGTTVALLGFALVLLIDQYSENNFNRPIIIFLIVMLTMAVGAFWEIFEFTVDTLLGVNMQHGLNDTMLDMIFVLIGAILVAALGNIYLRRLSKRTLSRLFMGNPVLTDRVYSYISELPRQNKKKE
ncbi:MAG TPA: DUF2238 domain-containing protein [Methanoculleus sp.]|nr:DUF2238 domain-containing protein [Methanoculleus sp.]